METTNKLYDVLITTRSGRKYQVPRVTSALLNHLTHNMATTGRGTFELQDHGNRVVLAICAIESVTIFNEREV